MGAPRKYSPPDTCSAPGCGSLPQYRWMCRKHYDRWNYARKRDTGELLHQGRLSAGTVQEKFNRGYTVNPLSGCWIWNKVHGARGLTQIYVGNYKQELPYRVGYTLYRGPIPEGHEIHHMCQNPICVNPAHLEALSPSAHKERHR